jgi:hypothetical protein
MLAGGAVVADPLLAGGALAGLGVAGTGYTPMGQRLLASLIAGRQGPGYQAARNALQQAAPAIGMGTATQATTAAKQLSDYLKNRN